MSTPSDHHSDLVVSFTALLDDDGDIRTDDESAATVDARCNEARVLVNQILETPATTLEGLKSQVAVAAIVEQIAPDGTRDVEWFCRRFMASLEGINGPRSPTLRALMPDEGDA